MWRGSVRKLVMQARRAGCFSADLDGGDPGLAGFDDGVGDALAVGEVPGCVRVGEADEGERGIVDNFPAAFGELCAEQIAHCCLVADGGGVAFPAGDGEGEEELSPVKRRDHCRECEKGWTAWRRSPSLGM